MAKDSKRDEDRERTIHERLRKARICKRRYGRATLSIARHTGIATFDPNRPLAKALRAFRERRATAEDVAWAFIRSRVLSHSPTFSWEGADLQRLIKLVAECSTSPRLTAETPAALADELVKAEHVEHEELRRSMEQLGRSLNLMTGAVDMDRLFAPLRQQQSAFRALSRAVMPRLTSGFLSSGGFPPSLLNSTAFPAFRTIAASRRSLPDFALSEVRLPPSVYAPFSESLRTSLMFTSIPPALAALTESPTFTLLDLQRAATETADLAKREGAEEEGQTLEALSQEIDMVAKQPSLADIQQAITTLHERLDEIETTAKRDKRAAAWFGVYLFILQALLALLLFYLQPMLGTRTGQDVID
jgi:polyhydroxyalkanoate synthesis regulator phasin